MRQIIMLIPMVLILPLFMGLKGIWIAFPVSDLGAFAVTLMMFRVEMKYLKHICVDT